MVAPARFTPAVNPLIHANFASAAAVAPPPARVTPIAVNATPGIDPKILHDAAEIVDKPRTAFTNATLPERVTMLQALQSREGYRSGWAWLLLPLDVLSLIIGGWAWNKHSVIFRGFTTSDREAVVNILETTPEKDRGALVAELHRTGLDVQLRRRVAGDKESSAVEGFLRLNVQGLSVDDIYMAFNMFNYSREEVQYVFTRMTAEYGAAKTDAVGKRLVDSGWFAKMIAEPWDVYDPRAARLPRDIMKPADFNVFAKTRYAADWDTVSNNPVYKLFPVMPPNRQTVEAFEKQFKSTHDRPRMHYDAQASAEAAVNSATTFELQADLLSKVEEVLGSDYVKTLEDNVMNSPAVSRYANWSWGHGVCSVESDYFRIQNDLINFDDRIANPVRAEFAEFVRNSHLSEGFIERIRARLEQNFTAARQSARSTLDACAANINNERDRQIRSLTDEISSRTRQIESLEQDKAQLVAAGKSTAEINDRIQRARDERSRAQGQLDEILHRGPFQPSSGHVFN